VLQAGLSANGSYGTANQVLTSNGSVVYWANSSGGGSAGGILTDQQYTGDGTTTTFTVTGGYTSNNFQVYLNGVLLRNGTEVTATNGSTFTITPAPASGALIDAFGFSGISTNGVGTTVSQQFTANGTANSFTVTGGYVPNQVQVYLNGLKQTPGTNVVITSGNTVNFAVAPANGYIVDVYGVQSSITLTSNTLTVAGSITANTLTINAVPIVANTGLVGNTSGLFVNSAYIATLAANSATYANSSVTNTFTVGTAAYHVANGNFGVGTSSPAYKLDVNGIGRIPGLVFSSTGDQYLYDSGSGAATIRAGTGGSDVYYTFYANGQFASLNGGGYFNGNVGIGTSSPAYSLDVNGNSRFTGTSNFQGNTSVPAAIFTNTVELANVTATSATNTVINYYLSSQSILYYTANSANNFTLNFAYSSGTTMNTAIAIGQTVTCVFMNTNGTTAYYANAFQIDGSAVTPKWQGGTAPSAGDASSIDVYQFSITKTASATYTVLASMTQYK
jgi:hypothetical protein